MERKNRRRKNRNLLLAFFIVYFATFLPNFGILNSLKWIGPFPLPMAWVLFLNAINTIITLMIYFQLFKPFAEKFENKLNDKEGD